MGIAASSAGSGETSASQRHTALATKHASALAGMLGLDLRDGVKYSKCGKIYALYYQMVINQSMLTVEIEFKNNVRNSKL